MGNGFVQYLSTMNNANSDNLNALAESQVTNEYYNQIMVDRKLGLHIVENIKSGINKCYIITGHAGDGKTSILVQVLKELNLLEEGKKLSISETIEKNSVNLFYVKDMSELDNENQKKLLLEALRAPNDNKSSILISNTGPLLKSFTDLFGENEEDKDEVEDILLKNLDVNNEDSITIDNYEFNLINIARVENVSFVREIINKICVEKLWSECVGCSNSKKCPMYYNYQCVNENKERVSSFIETYYKWLSENNKRITIRQMIAQISYAFTGNIRCGIINKFDDRNYNKFNYNFANLFFGYRGIQELDEANQIRGIALIKELGLDSIALKQDYEMFVKSNYEMFNRELEIVLSEIWREFSKHFYWNNDSYEGESIEKQHNIRKAVRRFYLMYGKGECNKDELYSQLYGDMFVKYLSLTTEKQSPRQLRSLRDVIFQAIYIKNIGVPPKDEDNLYLTLTRYDGSFQNVLLLLAKARKGDLEVVQTKRRNSFEDTDQIYNLQLVIDRKEKFDLDLPILMHFAGVVNGEISTEINPSLSHGLIELNSLLLKQFRNNEDYEKTINVIVNTVSGNKEFEIEVEEDKIYIY